MRSYGKLWDIIIIIFRKKMHKGRIVGSFLVGNKTLYDFVDNNPFIGEL